MLNRLFGKKPATTPQQLSDSVRYGKHDRNCQGCITNIPNNCQCSIKATHTENCQLRKYLGRYDECDCQDEVTTPLSPAAASSLSRPLTPPSPSTAGIHDPTCTSLSNSHYDCDCSLSETKNSDSLAVASRRSAKKQQTGLTAGYAGNGLAEWQQDANELQRLKSEKLRQEAAIREQLAAEQRAAAARVAAYEAGLTHQADLLAQQAIATSMALLQTERQAALKAAHEVALTSHADFLTQQAIGMSLASLSDEQAENLVRQNQKREQEQQESFIRVSSLTAQNMELDELHALYRDDDPTRILRCQFIIRELRHIEDSLFLRTVDLRSQQLSIAILKNCILELQVLIPGLSSVTLGRSIEEHLKIAFFQSKACVRAAIRVYPEYSLFLSPLVTPPSSPNITPSLTPLSRTPTLSNAGFKVCKCPDSSSCIHDAPVSAAASSSAAAAGPMLLPPPPMAVEKTAFRLSPKDPNYMFLFKILNDIVAYSFALNNILMSSTHKPSRFSLFSKSSEELLEEKQRNDLSIANQLNLKVNFILKNSITKIDLQIHFDTISQYQTQTENPKLLTLLTMLVGLLKSIIKPIP